eukprot:1597074-Rhodomonas_salina.2
MATPAPPPSPSPPPSPATEDPLVLARAGPASGPESDVQDPRAGCTVTHAGSRRLRSVWAGSASSCPAITLWEAPWEEAERREKRTELPDCETHCGVGARRE